MLQFFDSPAEPIHLLSHRSHSFLHHRLDHLFQLLAPLESVHEHVGFLQLLTQPIFQLLRIGKRVVEFLERREERVFLRGIELQDEGVCGIRLEEIGTWWLGERRLAGFVGPRFGIAVLGPPSLVGVGGTTLEVIRGTV
jgi:hypothetical protein